MHTTNYTNAFISVAEDCTAHEGAVPPEKQAKTVARMQYDLLVTQPYQHTSDDVLFAVYAERNQIVPEAYAQRRAEFFSKGQACLRASPLPKSYGWGVHFDADGKVALYARSSAEYERFAQDPALKQLKAMRSSK